MQNLEATFSGLKLTSATSTFKSPTKEVSCAALDEVKHKVHDTLLASKGTNFRYLALPFCFPLAEANISSWVRELCHVFHARQLKVPDDKLLSVLDAIIPFATHGCGKVVLEKWAEGRETGRYYAKTEFCSGPYSHVAKSP